MHYTTRFVCFVDILGFKDIINKSAPGGNENTEVTTLIAKTINSIKYYCDESENDGYHNIDFQFTQFSDCFIISYEYSEQSQTFYTMLKLLWTQAELADKGIMSRGGIALGLASHTPEHVFGPAVVAAYNMEQKATFPRIVTTEDVLVSGAKNRIKGNLFNEEYEYLTEILKRDDDGLYYVDYFEAIQIEIDDSGYEYPEYLLRLGNHIHKGLQHQNIRVKQKYEWMKHKYNAIVGQILYNIENHGNPNADPELVDYYMTLKKVTG